MSRTTNNTELDSSVVEVGSLVDAIKETVTPVKSTVVLASARTISPTQRIGVVRYLQIKPQDRGIEVIMKKQYAMKAYTISQWDEIVIKVKTRIIN